MARARQSYFLLLLSRLWTFAAVFATVWIVAAVGFYFLEPNISVLNSFYWAIITLGTVGYGDVVPTVTYAKFWTIGVAVTQIFLLGYLISVISATVTEEHQHRILGTLGTTMKDHIVILGYTPIGQAALRELLAQEERVAVITEEVTDVANLRTLAHEDRLFATYGPPAERQMLERVNIQAAHSVIVATKDDTTNLIAALNVRSLVPKVRIVVSVNRPELRETLETAGVTYVASPGDMGGRLCADAAFRPEVANAIEELTTVSSGADMSEYMLSADTPISNQTLLEAEGLVRKHTDCLVLGYARHNGTGDYTTVLNPPQTFRFQPGDAIIIMGSLDNIHKFHRWFGIEQGR